MAQHERRATERRRQYRAARFIFDHGSRSLDAFVRNLSPDGARLEAQHLFIVPEEFNLMVDSASCAPRQCRARRVWLKDGAMGVAFIASS